MIKDPLEVGTMNGRPENFSRPSAMRVAFWKVNRRAVQIYPKIVGGPIRGKSALLPVLDHRYDKTKRKPANTSSKDMYLIHQTSCPNHIGVVTQVWAKHRRSESTYV